MDIPNQAALSVIIPTYNRAEMLGRALNSVTRQTMLPKEIIVVDDGSDDDSETIVHSFRTQNSILIRFFRQENKGPAAARNRGIALASQPVVAFLDSDDHWHRKKIEIQYPSLMTNHECKISHTREKWLRRGKHLNQKKIHQQSGGVIFSSCLQRCCVGMSTTMVEKSVFSDYGCFDERLPCCEDYDLWLRVSLYEPFLLIDQALTIKEGGRGDQVSSIYRVGMDQYRIYALLKLLDSEIMDPEKEDLTKTVLLEKCTIYGNGCLKHGKIAEADRMMAIIKRYSA